MPFRRPVRVPPPFLGFAFAMTIAPVVIQFLVVTVIAPHTTSWLGVANLLLVVALWFLLRWDRTRPVLGVTIAVLFVLAALGLGMTVSSGMHLFVPILGLANLSFVVGPRIAMTVVVGVALLLTTAEWLAFDGTLDSVVGIGLLMTAGGGLAVALGATAARAQRDRDEAVSLAARIRDLTLADERARMSREMHDSVGHHLTVATMSLSNAVLLRPSDDHGAWGQVTAARAGVDRALSETRLWVRALRPASLEEHGLVGALRALTASPGGIDVRCSIEGSDEGLPSEVGLALYRTAQEGLANAVRHARAERVEVRLHLGPDDAELQVLDDGTPTTDIVEGFGLTALRERADAVGGELDLVPGTPQCPGTRLRLRVPRHRTTARRA